MKITIKYLLSSIGRLFLVIRRIRRAAMIVLLKPLFKSCGTNVRFDPDGSYSFSSISIGNDVFIGRGASFSARISSISIGNKVMFGPNVTIRGGNHNTDQLGQFMFDVHDKRSEDDLPVIVENDVWVGTGAIILKGVTIGRGAVIAAGAVVNKSIPPYAIAGGVPARVIGFRWSLKTILEHEMRLYPEDERLPIFFIRASMDNIDNL